MKRAQVIEGHVVRTHNPSDLTGNPEQQSSYRISVPNPNGGVSEYVGEVAPIHFDTETTAATGLGVVAGILQGSDEALMDAKARVVTKPDGAVLQEVSFRAEKQGGQFAPQEREMSAKDLIALVVLVLFCGLALWGAISIVTSG